MWNGRFTPSMVKHHMRARIIDRVSVKTDPVTEEPFKNPRPYYKVEVMWPPIEQTYIYLIPSAVAREVMVELDESKIEDVLNQELSESDVVAIMNAVIEYTKNPVPGGRDWRDYLTDKELQRQIDKEEASKIFALFG